MRAHLEELGRVEERRQQHKRQNVPLEVLRGYQSGRKKVLSGGFVSIISTMVGRTVVLFREKKKQPV